MNKKNLWLAVKTVLLSYVFDFVVLGSGMFMYMILFILSLAFCIGKADYNCNPILNFSISSIGNVLIPIALSGSFYAALAIGCKKVRFSNQDQEGKKLVISSFVISSILPFGVILIMVAQAMISGASWDLNNNSLILRIIAGIIMTILIIANGIASIIYYKRSIKQAVQAPLTGGSNINSINN